MKKLADRMSLIKPSSTLAITAKAGELKALGKKVMSFGAGEPDFDTPEVIKAAAVAAIKAGKTKYTPTQGTPELKDAIIHKLKRDNNLNYTRDEIIVSNGGKHSLFNIAMALFETGDEVIIPAPFWVSYPEQVILFGAKAIIVNTTDKDHFKITPEQLAKAITPKTKAFIINSPSNPTGAAYTKDELKALADICVKNDVFIISDEIYEHIVYDGFVSHAVASLSPQIKNITITVNGASKCYSMTGWRMGFAAGPANIIKAMGKLQDQSTSNICSITQAACVEAFNGNLDEVKKMCAAFAERRTFIVKALNDIAGISCLTPEGAFYVFPNISELFGKKTPQGRVINSSEDFCLYLLEDHLVACVPGSAFGAEGYMRMSYATSMDVIKEGVVRIHKASVNLI